MDWKKIERSVEAQLGGVSIAVTRENGSITAVDFTDAAGKQVRVSLNSYSMFVLVPAKPETRKVTEINGAVAGVPFSTVIEEPASSYEVTSKVRDLQSAGADDVAAKEIDQEIPF